MVQKVGQWPSCPLEWIMYCLGLNAAEYVRNRTLVCSSVRGTGSHERVTGRLAPTAPAFLRLGIESLPVLTSAVTDCFLLI